MADDKPVQEKLVPDFAVEESDAQGWGQLTEVNSDYENLWSSTAREAPEEVTDVDQSVEADDEAAAISAEVAETPGFRGTLVTGDEVLAASILVGPEIIVLWGGGHEIGAWNRQQAKIARLTNSRFAIHAEGDTLTFTADDPIALDQAISDSVPAGAGSVSVDEVAAPVAAAVVHVETEKTVLADIALPAEAKFETIADNVRARSSSLVKARRFTTTPQAVLIKVGVYLVIAAVVAGLLYLGLLVSGLVGEPTATTAVNPPTTGIPVIITTAPLTTVATTLPPPMTTLFETEFSDLVARWNGLAAASEVPILIPPDLESPFFLLLGPGVTLEGLIDRTAGNVTLRASPTGTPEGDAPIITALGLLIATADPTLDGGDRRALLEQLGLDVDDPALVGLDQTLTYNGLAYRLAYDEAANSLALIITPETAPVTTTTN
ncbi:MAG: hypothetical protein ACR2ME_02525 [Acidimicrobiia bacterium]